MRDWVGAFLEKNFMIFEESFIDERRSGGILLLYFLIRGMVKRLSRVTLTHLFGVRIPVPLLEDRMMSSILFVSCFNLCSLRRGFVESLEFQ